MRYSATAYRHVPRWRQPSHGGAVRALTSLPAVATLSGGARARYDRSAARCHLHRTSAHAHCSPPARKPPPGSGPHTSPRKSPGACGASSVAHDRTPEGQASRASRCPPPASRRAALPDNLARAGSASSERAQRHMDNRPVAALLSGPSVALQARTLRFPASTRRQCRCASSRPKSVTFGCGPRGRRRRRFNGLSPMGLCEPRPHSTRSCIFAILPLYRRWGEQ